MRSSISGGVTGPAQPDDGVPVGRLMLDSRTARRSTSTTCTSSDASRPRRCDRGWRTAMTRCWSSSTAWYSSSRRSSSTESDGALRGAGHGRQVDHGHRGAQAAVQPGGPTGVPEPVQRGRALDRRGHPVGPAHAASAARPCRGPPARSRSAGRRRRPGGSRAWSKGYRCRPRRRVSACASDSAPLGPAGVGSAPGGERRQPGEQARPARARR